MAQQRLESRDRVTLLLSFVPYLLNHSPVALADIAQHFDITLAQAEELIRLLAMSGIPGETGSYQHEDLFDINWELFEEHKEVELWTHVGVDSTPRFSAREAAVLVAGLQYISSIVPQSDIPLIDSLLRKIAAGSAVSPENLSVAPVDVAVDISALAQAITTHQPMTFTYRSASRNREVRTVDPLRLDVVGSSWYLRAYCHDRKALRTFRLDRMSDLAKADSQFSSTSTIEDIPSDLYESAETDIVVNFSVNPAVLPLIRGYHPEIVRDAEDGNVVIAVRFSRLESIPPFAMKVPGALQILSPAVAQEYVQHWASQALASYTT